MTAQVIDLAGVRADLHAARCKRLLDRVKDATTEYDNARVSGQPAKAMILLSRLMRLRAELTAAESVRW